MSSSSSLKDRCRKQVFVFFYPTELQEQKLKENRQRLTLEKKRAAKEEMKEDLSQSLDKTSTEITDLEQLCKFTSFQSYLLLTNSIDILEYMHCFKIDPHAFEIFC